MTDKQKAFCQEYLKDFNAKQAAIRAGYSKDTAKQIGTENLSKLDLQVEINRLIDERTERVTVKQDRVIYELAKLAFADLGNYVEITDTGVNIKNTEDVDTSVLQEVSEHVTKDGGSTKVKLYDKIKALDLLCKHLGITNDKLELLGKDGESFKIVFTKDDEKSL